MSLYKVMFDSDNDYIEANSFGDAVAAWQAEMKRQNEGDWDDDEQPESVTLVTDKPVLRVITGYAYERITGYAYERIAELTEALNVIRAYVCFDQEHHDPAECAAEHDDEEHRRALHNAIYEEADKALFSVSAPSSDVSPQGDRTGPGEAPSPDEVLSMSELGAAEATP